MAYSYACADYPGMDDCPAAFKTATEEELWKILELHAMEAHDEDPAAWPQDERRLIAGLIKSD